MNEIQNISLSNFGLIKVKLPDSLFNKLKLECNTCSNNKEFVSGLSSDGIANHYLLTDSTAIKSFALDTANLYCNEYSDAVTWKIKSDDLDSSKLIPWEPWINLQTKNQWIPPHNHSGLLAYTVWIDIPSPSIFEIIYNTISGETMKRKLYLSEKDNGYMLMFPSKLIHCVYPYNEELTRISISGNLALRHLGI